MNVERTTATSRFSTSAPVFDSRVQRFPTTRTAPRMQKSVGPQRSSLPSKLSRRPICTLEAYRTQACRRSRHQGALRNPQCRLWCKLVKLTAALSAVLLSPASACKGHGRTSSHAPPRKASPDRHHSGAPTNNSQAHSLPEHGHWHINGHCRNPAPVPGLSGMHALSLESKNIALPSPGLARSRAASPCMASTKSQHHNILEEFMVRRLDGGPLLAHSVALTLPAQWVLMAYWMSVHRPSNSEVLECTSRAAPTLSTPSSICSHINPTPEETGTTRRIAWRLLPTQCARRGTLRVLPHAHRRSAPHCLALFSRTMDVDFAQEPRTGTPSLPSTRLAGAQPWDSFRDSEQQIHRRAPHPTQCQRRRESKRVSVFWRRCRITRRAS